MTATIAYDLPMKNLIDALSRTGHVTHTAYRKTSVTIHHNAGRLSHEGCLAVWKVRPASAHFDVDRSGAACQYVKVNEYAWAAGNKEGNIRSIHIEMANSATGGQWPVAEVTWMSAARLAGWLHAKVIGARPSKSTLFYHHHWRATACAGPYMDSVYPRVLAAAQSAYDSFVKAPVKPPVPATVSRGDSGAVVKSLQTGLNRVFPSYSRLKVDGSFGPATEAVVKEFQRRTGLARDGRVGPATRAKLATFGVKI